MCVMSSRVLEGSSASASSPRWVRGVLIAVIVGGSACDASGPLHVDVLYPSSGIGDRSYSDAVYAGLVEAGTLFDFTTTQAAPASDDEAAALFASWLAMPRHGDEMIITVGIERMALVEAANCQYDGRVVLHLDNSLPPCPSLQTVVYSVYPPSFLAGVAAMSISTLKKAAVIGGMSMPAVDRYIRGFIAGVTYAGGDVVAVDYLSDDLDGFASPAKAFQVAEADFALADVVFPVAGGSGAGAFAAAKEASGRYVIGVDQDQSWLGPEVVIGSAVKHLDVSVKDAIGAFAEHRFQAGAIVASLENGGVEFVANPAFASRCQDAVDAAREAAVAAGNADDEENPL